MEDNLQRIISDVADSLGAELRACCSLPAARMAEEAMSEERTREQVGLLESAVGPLEGRRVLEIGTGYGMFVCFTNRAIGADSYGVEPSGFGFSGATSIAQRLLRLYEVEPWRIIPGTGEALPLRSESFDVVYSCNVLEHVHDPEGVIKEAIRILKPGGYLFFVVPNYGSFWEGHYGIIWIPYLSHRLARWYIRLFGKDPTYLAALQLLNYFSLRRCVRGIEKEVEVLDLGEDVFRYRMKTLDFGEWGAVGTLKRLVRLSKSLRLNTLVAEVLTRCKAHPRKRCRGPADRPTIRSRGPT